MSKGGGQSPTGDTLLPLLEQNYSSAQGLAAQPFTPYTGQLSAPMPGATLAADETARRVGSYWQNPIEAAQMGATPNVQAGAGVSGIDAYMNPYTQQVIDTTLADIDRSRQMAITQGESDAAMSNAWGGARHGVADSLTNEAYGRTAADTAAGLRMGGFNTAAGLMQSDFDRALQAALANQGVGFQTSQQNAGLQQQANLANQGANFEGMRNQLAAAETLGGLGMQQYGMQQAALDAQIAEFLRQINQPYVGQDVLNKALGMFGTMSGQWQPPGAPTGGAAGGFGDIASGAAALINVLSDERTKTDIRTAGYDARGRRWVDFRYKWDDPGTIRRGVIAQELIETDPRAVSQDQETGYLMVDYSQL